MAQKNKGKGKTPATKPAPTLPANKQVLGGPGSRNPAMAGTILPDMPPVEEQPTEQPTGQILPPDANTEATANDLDEKVGTPAGEDIEAIKDDSGSDLDIESMPPSIPEKVVVAEQPQGPVETQEQKTVPGKNNVEYSLDSLEVVCSRLAGMIDKVIGNYANSQMKDLNMARTHVRLAGDRLKKFRTENPELAKTIIFAQPT